MNVKPFDPAPLLQAVSTLVRETDATTRAALVEQITAAVAASDAQRDEVLTELRDAIAADLDHVTKETAQLKAMLETVEKHAKKPLEQAASVVRAAHRATEQAQDALDAQRRMARGFLIDTARGLC